MVLGGNRTPPAWRARGGFVGLLAVALLHLACHAEPPAPYAPGYGAQPGLPPPARKVYRFGVHPLHNPQRLAEIYGPIVELVNRSLDDATLVLEASRSYEEFEAKLAGRQLDFALPNPIQALRAGRSGYRVFGKMGDDQLFRGTILVRRDGGVTRVEDLKGKVVSFPAPTALAATMMPLYFLHTHGLDANRDVARLYAGSQESSIMAVYLGTSAAAATWPVPWALFQKTRPEIAAQLEVRWETPALVNNALVARDDVPPGLVARVGAALFALHTHEEGRRLLAEVPLSRFEPATDATYAKVREFMTAYDRVVR